MSFFLLWHHKKIFQYKNIEKYKFFILLEKRWKKCFYCCRLFYTTIFVIKKRRREGYVNAKDCVILQTKRMTIFIDSMTKSYGGRKTYDWRKKIKYWRPSRSLENRKALISFCFSLNYDIFTPITKSLKPCTSFRLYVCLWPSFSRLKKRRYRIQIWW